MRQKPFKTLRKNIFAKYSKLYLNQNLSIISPAFLIAILKSFYRAVKLLRGTRKQLLCIIWVTIRFENSKALY